MRNRAGWEVAAAAVAFSQCVCSSDRQTLGAFFFLFSPSSNLPHGAAGSRTAGGGGNRSGSTRAICYNQLVCESTWTLCVYSGGWGSDGPGQHLQRGTVLTQAMPELLKKTEKRKEPASSTYP